jgi:lipopolysaccharide transport system ATP-binding protein
MDDTALRIEDLGKQYRIGHLQHHDTLRDALVAGLRAPLARLQRDGGNREIHEHTIWALRNVSIDVKPGQAVGIIGRNGAGKTTLLKILSRITEPTEGRVVVRGRVGSLLEVGTGFHPELTGRENIYLNGAILGMRRAEIEHKFDEIVAFAEIEKFLDTPVKRYSSGMYVRLAFAVAAHLEPEILLVDEVLAVGDAAFQKKCLGKMEEVSYGGRTVLFVSHNMAAVQSLCERAIWLHEGKPEMDGPARQIVSAYLRASGMNQNSRERSWGSSATAPGNDKIRLRSVRVRPENGSPLDLLTMQTPLRIEIEYWNLVPESQLHTTLHIYNEQGIVAFSTFPTGEAEWHKRCFPQGLFRSVCRIPGHLLNSGLYRVTLLVVKDGSSVIYRHEDTLSFEVVDTSAREGAWYGKEPGVVMPQLEWETTYLGQGDIAT